MILKNKFKHIVLLTPGFPEKEFDSTIIPALQIFVKSLRELNPNLKIQIISFQFPFTKEKYKWNSLNVFPLNGKNKKIKKISTWVKAFNLLRRIHKENSIDVIHSFWIGECSTIGSVFSKRNNIKHIVTAMGQDVFKSNKFAKYLTKDTKVVSLSENQHNFLKQNLQIGSKIISWGIDSKSFPKTAKKNIDILGVGFFNEVKNYTEFINVIEKLSQKNSNLKVEIIGDGILKPIIEKQIKEKKLEHIITLQGLLAREEVLLKMAKAKVLLHTSKYESFGMVFIEALYLGMKIVSFDVGIAEQSTQWFICNNGLQMNKVIKEILEKPVRVEQILIKDISQTVNDYTLLYE